MNVAAIIALIALLLLIGVLIYLAARRPPSCLCVADTVRGGKNAEVFLYVPHRDLSSSPSSSSSSAPSSLSSSFEPSSLSSSSASFSSSSSSASSSSASTLENTPKTNENQAQKHGFQDFRHAYSESQLLHLNLATEKQVRDAARDGAYWNGLGFAADGYLYEFDGSGTPIRYEQHELLAKNQSKTAKKREFGVLVFAEKPLITSAGSQQIAAWNEAGHGYLPIWSQKSQRYPHDYRHRRT